MPDLFDDPFDPFSTDKVDSERSEGIQECPPPLPLVPTVPEGAPDQGGDTSFERERLDRYSDLIFGFVRLYKDFHHTKRGDIKKKIEDLFDEVRALAPYLGFSLLAVPDLMC